MRSHSDDSDVGGEWPTSGLRRVYVLYLHGIGMRDRANFIGPILSHLREVVTSDGQDWQQTSCVADCQVDAFGEHSHMLASSSTSRVEVTVQPFHWGADVSPRRSPVVAWWVFRAALAVTLLQLVAPWGVLVRRVRWATAFWEGEKGRGVVWVAAALAVLLLPFATILLVLPVAVWLIWLLLRAATFLLLGAVALVLVTLYGLVASGVGLLDSEARAKMLTPVLLVNDALVWCSDDTFRRWVVQECDQRITAARADHHVLIGHSQGGSILTEWTRAADLEAVPSTLMTLGSGQGILATLHEALKSWRGWLSLVAIAAIVAFIGAVGLVMAAVVGSIPEATSQLEMSQQMMQLVWLGGAVSHEHLRAVFEEAARLASLSYAAALTQLAAPEPPAAVASASYMLSLVLLGLLSVVLLVIRPLARAIVARCRTDAAGLDLSASRDPISRPLHVLGPLVRLRRIPQTGSVALDHVRYSTNQIAVWPAIATSIQHAVAGVPFENVGRLQWDAAHGYAIYEHRLELNALRTVRAIAMAVAILPLLDLAAGAPTDFAAVAVSTLIAIAAWWACHARGAYLLRRNSALAITDDLRVFGEERRSRRSFPRGFLLVALALPLFGAITLPSDLGPIVLASHIDAAESARTLAAPSFLALACSASLFIRGSRMARPVTFVASIAASLSWFVLGWDIASVWCVASMTLGLLCVVLPIRRLSKYTPAPTATEDVVAQSTPGSRPASTPRR